MKPPAKLDFLSRRGRRPREITGIEYIQSQHEATYFERHLEKVASIVHDHARGLSEEEHDNLILTAYGHDLFEDTQANYIEARAILGDTVTELIWRLTDEPGPNRNTRKAKSYWKIREDDRAIAVKIADRIQNMQRCLIPPMIPHMGPMYAKEASTFVSALWTPKSPAYVHALWDTFHATLSDLETYLANEPADAAATS